MGREEIEAAMQETSDRLSKGVSPDAVIVGALQDLTQAVMWQCDLALQHWVKPEPVVHREKFTYDDFTFFAAVAEAIAAHRVVRLASGEGVVMWTGVPVSFMTMEGDAPGEDDDMRDLLLNLRMSDGSLSRRMTCELLDFYLEGRFTVGPWRS